MSKAKVLRFSSLLVWLMTLVLAGRMLSLADWSDSMIHSVKAGFHTGGTSPIVALELADSLSVQEGVLPDTPDGEKDRLSAIIQIAADYPFIVAYTALFSLLILRDKPGLRLYLLLALTLCVGVCDALENGLLMSALQKMRQATPEMNQGLMTLWWCSALKWMGLFALLACIGFLEIARDRQRQDVLPAVIRCLMGLLFLVGGLTGLAWGFGKNSGLLIENAMVFMMAALVLLPFLVWKPDEPWR